MGLMFVKWRLSRDKVYGLLQGPGNSSLDIKEKSML